MISNNSLLPTWLSGARFGLSDAVTVGLDEQAAARLNPTSLYRFQFQTALVRNRETRVTTCCKARMTRHALCCMKPIAPNKTFSSTAKPRARSSGKSRSSRGWRVRVKEYVARASFLVICSHYAGSSSGKETSRGTV